LIAQKLVRRFIKVSIIMPIKNPDKYQIWKIISILLFFAKVGSLY
jgi:hypothetical protein